MIGILNQLGIGNAARVVCLIGICLFYYHSYSTVKKDNTGKMVNLGDQFPDFTADSTIGKLNFHEWLGNS